MMALRSPVLLCVHQSGGGYSRRLGGFRLWSGVGEVSVVSFFLFFPEFLFIYFLCFSFVCPH